MRARLVCRSYFHDHHDLPLVRAHFVSGLSGSPSPNPWDVMGTVSNDEMATGAAGVAAGPNRAVTNRGRRTAPEASDGHQGGRDWSRWAEAPYRSELGHHAAGELGRGGLGHRAAVSRGTGPR
jgi:hypothetical protein